MELGAVYRPLAAVAVVRVKLVFVEELATFVLRQRGFSACWFLVPPTARLVGDLLHDITREFELRERCPQGIELLLDGFHMLANQEIGMVRENDTLAVHCVAFVGGATKRRRGETEENAMVDKTEKKKKKKRKDASTQEETESKKPRTMEKKRSEAAPAPATKPGKKTTEKLGAKRVVSSTPVDSSSSSSDSSSSSESSDGEDEDEVVKPAPVHVSKEAFRKVVKETVKSMKEDVPVLSASTAESSSDESSDSDSSDSSEEEAAPTSKPTDAKRTKNGKPTGKDANGSETRTRRRRRPRRRPKNGTTADKESSERKPLGKQQKANGKGTPSSLSTATPTLDTHPMEIRPLRIRGVPQSTTKNRGTSHVRFDGPPVATPDLDKYGPQSHKKTASAGVPPQTAQEPEDIVPGDVPAAKKPFKEMWKRPYEIISSIHDVSDPLEKTNGKPSLDTLLSTFPSKPTEGILPTAVGLQTDDIVAYKTLTLCMETFQPVVSDWLCGQVVDVIDEDRTVTFIPYSWEWPTKYTAGKSLSWKQSQPHAGEDACVSVNQDDISELRYLHGPTRAHLESPSS